MMSMADGGGSAAGQQVHIKVLGGDILPELQQEDLVVTPNVLNAAPSARSTGASVTDNRFEAERNIKFEGTSGPLDQCLLGGMNVG